MLDGIEGASNAAWAFVQDVGVYHGGANVGVAQYFLYGAYVVAIFQQVRRK